MSICHGCKRDTRICCDMFSDENDSDVDVAYCAECCPNREEHYRMLHAEEQCIVICRGDQTGDEKAPYVLATRYVFINSTEADIYAATVNTAREPLVVLGRFNMLRFGLRF